MPLSNDACSFLAANILSYLTLSLLRAALNSAGDKSLRDLRAGRFATGVKETR
jgi:hypothetical protein